MQQRHCRGQYSCSACFHSSIRCPPLTRSGLTYSCGARSPKFKAMMATNSGETVLEEKKEKERERECRVTAEIAFTLTTSNELIDVRDLIRASLPDRNQLRPDSNVSDISPPVQQFRWRNGRKNRFGSDAYDTERTQT
jgi:hypothetical protein